MQVPGVGRGEGERGRPMRRLATWFLLAFVLLVGAPVGAAVETHEPTGLRIVASSDWLQALDPKEGTVAWSRPVREAADVSILPAGDDVWLLAGKDWLEALRPATGQRLWRREGLEFAWGPEVVGSAVWTAESGETPEGQRIVTLRSRNLSTGEDLWSNQQSLSLVSAHLGERELLVQLRPFPRPVTGSKYLRETGPPSPPRLGEDRLVMLDERGGLRWSVPLGADVEGGPWSLGDYILTEERDRAGRYLSARHRDNGGPVWTLPLGAPLASEPELVDGRLRLVVATDQGPVMNLLELARAKPVWHYRMPGDLALPPMAEGSRLVLLFLEPDPAAKDRPQTRVTSLDGATGQPTGPSLAVPGVPAQAVPLGDRLFLLQNLASSEPSLDRHGRAIPDLVEGKPATRVVEGYRLYEIHDGTARVLAEDPRSALLVHPDLGTPAEVAGDLLLYQARLVPPQKEGERRSEEARHPEEPPVLHAFDLVAGRERWAWQAPADRLETGWTLLEDTLYVTTADRSTVSGNPVSRLLALDLATGKERWRSPWLTGMAGAPEVVASGLYVLTSSDVAYVLDPATGTVRTSRSLAPVFNWVKWNNLAGVLLLSGCIAWFIFHAQRRNLFIRRIAGLSALDEAVGRSTEMGKPVMYVPGLADVDDIQTLASLSILGHVARRTAEYDTPLLVPNSRSVVMSMAQEVVKESYTSAGRPDSFQRENVRYLTDEQFGFAAGVSGMMLRERPAANFYMGTFFAEALILAETGNATAAIQIAGTASASQLPFFVAACDYTLIGEELYAASAWLSRDPMQVGSLKGQDAAKAAIMASILVGAVLFSLGFHWIKEVFLTS